MGCHKRVADVLLGGNKRDVCLADFFFFFEWNVWQKVEKTGVAGIRPPLSVDGIAS